jgi:hypothetical protein
MAVKQLQSRHLDRALVMRNHCPREVAVHVRAGRDAHRSVHLDHDGLQCTVELACCGGARSRDEWANRLRCARRERHGKRDTCDKRNDVRRTTVPPTRPEKVRHGR